MHISHDATKSKYSRSGRLLLIIACYQLFIPAREDFSTFFQECRNKTQKKCDSQQWKDKFF